MAHSHSHTPPYLPKDNNTHRLSYTSGVAAGSILVEVIGGFLSGSLASLADAGHMLTDTVVLLFALLAVQFSRRPPTIHHIFGWLRLTTPAVFVNIIALVVITILIVWEAIERLRTPRSVEGGMMMVIAVAGLPVSMLSFRLLHHSNEEKNLNVRIAALHVFGDLLGSVEVVTTALIIIWAGQTPANPVLSILVSLLVLRSAWWLLKDSMNELLEGVPVPLDIAELRRRMRRETPEVRNVHHVHAWMVGEKPVITLYVQIILPHDYDALLDQIQHYLVNHYQIEHATVQMEYQPCHESDYRLNEGVSGHSHYRHQWGNAREPLSHALLTHIRLSLSAVKVRTIYSRDMA